MAERPRLSQVIGRTLLAATVLGCSEADDGGPIERSKTDPASIVGDLLQPPLDLALPRARAAFRDDDPYLAGRWLARATDPLQPLVDSTDIADQLRQAERLAVQLDDDVARRCILQQLLIQTETRNTKRLVGTRLSLGETLGKLGDFRRSYRLMDSVLRAGASAPELERAYEARALQGLALAMAALGDVPAMLRLADATWGAGHTLSRDALVQRANLLLDLGMEYLQADRMGPAIAVSRAYLALPPIILPDRRLDALCLSSMSLLSRRLHGDVIELLTPELLWTGETQPVQGERALPWIMVLLADALSAAGHSGRALTLRQQTLELINDWDDQDPKTIGLPLLARAREGLARELGRHGKWDQAVVIDEQTFEMAWAWLPVGHRAAVDAVHDLAWSRAQHASASAAVDADDDLVLSSGRDAVVSNLKLLRVSMDAHATASLPLGRAASSARLAGLRDDLSLLLSLDAWAGLSADASFCLWETILIRHHALAIEPFAYHEDDGLAELHHRAVAAGHELSGLLFDTGGAGDGADAWRVALSREHAAAFALQQALKARGRKTPTIRRLALQTTLAPDQAIVSFVRSMRLTPAQPNRPATAVDSISAHVLLPRDSVQRVELGPREPIVAATDAWIASISEKGSADAAASRVLAELVLEPIWAAAKRAPRLIVRADDVLHRIPLSALDNDGIAPVLRVTWVPDFGTLLEPSEQRPGPRSLLVAGVPDLVGPSAGGVQLQRPCLSPAVDVLRQLSASEGIDPPTAALGLSVVLNAYRESGGDDGVSLPARRLTRTALAEQVAGRRIVHLGTPAWFAAGPATAPFDSDGRSRARRGVVNPAPATLAGLLVASAAGPPDALGRPRGIVTAEEIAGWDLSQTELVVLAAVDAPPTAHAGGARLGTLVTAFHQAGARSVLYPLWPAQPPFCSESSTGCSSPAG